MKTLEPRHWYLDVHMDYSHQDLPCKMTVDLVQVVLRAAVDTMFGEVSSSLPLDILKFDSKCGKVIIRVPSSNYAKVRAALTVCPSMRVAGKDIPVVYSVQQASSCLLSLAGPQRVIV
nr:ribonuclease P protein subunit p14-like [Cherax quadricarinatus]XP_053637866.1 ribonuclease P protein subunit p14-like [Cherax quadricarinatus]XP_053637867.1 ribonuclease P protein subunit p14-like [Cherax quadricarinatus]